MSHFDIKRIIFWRRELNFGIITKQPFPHWASSNVGVVEAIEGDERDCLAVFVDCESEDEAFKYVYSVFAGVDVSEGLVSSRTLDDYGDLVFKGGCGRSMSFLPLPI